jgi:hypothetical protein
MKSRKRKVGIEKRIGVKYCGGCNPTYDRMQVVRQLKSWEPHDSVSFSISGENELPLLIHWLTTLEGKENN